MRQRLRKKVRVFFRVLDLSEAQVAKMQTQIDGAKYGFRKYRLRRDPKVLGAEFTLKDKQPYNDLIRFLRVNKINKSSYGIWISLITNEDTGGTHVPEYVLKLYKKNWGEFGLHLYMRMIDDNRTQQKTQRKNRFENPCRLVRPAVARGVPSACLVE